MLVDRKLSWVIVVALLALAAAALALATPPAHADIIGPLRAGGGRSDRRWR
jgi:hypothetical protein